MSTIRPVSRPTGSRRRSFDFVVDIGHGATFLTVPRNDRLALAGRAAGRRNDGEGQRDRGFRLELVLRRHQHAHLAGLVGTDLDHRIAAARPSLPIDIDLGVRQAGTPST